MLYNKRPEKDQTFWEKIKNDEKGWFIAGPLFFIMAVVFLWIVKTFLF